MKIVFKNSYIVAVEVIKPMWDDTIHYLVVVNLNMLRNRSFMTYGKIFIENYEFNADKNLSLYNKIVELLKGV